MDEFVQSRHCQMPDHLQFAVSSLPVEVFPEKHLRYWHSGVQTKPFLRSVPQGRLFARESNPSRGKEDSIFLCTTRKRRLSLVVARRTRTVAFASATLTRFSNLLFLKHATPLGPLQK